MAYFFLFWAVVTSETTGMVLPKTQRTLSCQFCPNEKAASDRTAAVPGIYIPVYISVLCCLGDRSLCGAFQKASFEVFLLYPPFFSFPDQSLPSVTTIFFPRHMPVYY